MTERVPVSKLDASEQELVRLALEVRDRAYAPYSKFLVGCALRDVAGRVHVGCNVENASYSATICAERSALVSMVSSGCRDCRTIVVVTSSSEICFPCGVCLQVLGELGEDASIIAVDGSGKFFQRSTIHELNPRKFSREKLTR